MQIYMLASFYKDFLRISFIIYKKHFLAWHMNANLYINISSIFQWVLYHLIIFIKTFKCGCALIFQMCVINPLFSCGYYRCLSFNIVIIMTMMMIMIITTIKNIYYFWVLTICQILFLTSMCMLLDIKIIILQNI